MAPLNKLLDEIDEDLRQAPAKIVIYLEGPTDVDFFFPLLGVATPRDNLHHDVLVKPLNGSQKVAALVEAAKQNGRTIVLGIVDGDGLPLDELARQFDPPYDGPLFRWKAYCIENMLAIASWPAAWGNPPDWNEALDKYAPYVALNRLHSTLKNVLITLGLHQYRNPDASGELLTEKTVLQGLTRDKDLIAGFDVAVEFKSEIQAYRAAVSRSLVEAHTRLCGKWMISHLAPTLTGKPAPVCQQEWSEATRDAGGLADVREWWQRIIGSPP